MASKLTFDDIFQDDVEEVMEEVATFAKTHYSQPTRDSTPTPYPPSQNSHSIVSSTLLGVILALAIYWAVSFTLSLRQRLKREANELAQRRRHGIPDDDKRPFAEAYSDVVALRRKPLSRSKSRTELSKPNAPRISRPNVIFGSHESHGGSSIDLRYPSQEFDTLKNGQEVVSTLPKQPLINEPSNLRLIGAYPSESITSERADLRPLDPRRRAPVSGSLSSTQPLSILNRKVSGKLVDTSNTVKAAGRKRLFMDPRDAAERNHAAVAEPSVDDYSLPKRARNNTWSIEESNGTHLVRNAKRAADDETLEQTRLKSGGKRVKPARDGDQPSGYLPHEVQKVNGKEKTGANVTFAPSPFLGRKSRVGRRLNGASLPKLNGSQDENVANKAPPSPAPPVAGYKREREYAESDIGSEAGRASDAPPARKRGRERGSKPRPSKLRELISLDEKEEKDDDLRLGDDFIPDPLCGGRRPGEEWESGGLKFKVGLDGRRLRKETLVEKRPKYQMPMDSQHRDKVETIDVWVDKWFTEDEYLDAKSKGIFAWQQADKKATEADTQASSSPLRRPLGGRSSSTFWDAPDATTPPKASPVTNMDFNPFFSNRERAFSRLAAATQKGRTSIGSVGSIPQRAPSTRWQKQANEQEALRQLQEARKSAEKKRASETPATAPTPAPTVTPTPSVPPKPATPAPLFVPSTTPKTAEPAIEDKAEESSKEDKAKKPETSVPTFTLSTTPATPPVFPTAPSTAALPTKPSPLFAFPPKSESPTETKAAAKPVVNGTPAALFAAPVVSTAPHTGFKFGSTSVATPADTSNITSFSTPKPSEPSKDVLPGPFKFTTTTPADTPKSTFPTFPSRTATASQLSPTPVASETPKPSPFAPAPVPADTSSSAISGNKSLLDRLGPQPVTSTAATAFAPSVSSERSNPFALATSGLKSSPFASAATSQPADGPQAKGEPKPSTGFSFKGAATAASNAANKTVPPSPFHRNDPNPFGDPTVLPFGATSNSSTNRAWNNPSLLQGQQQTKDATNGSSSQAFKFGVSNTSAEPTSLTAPTNPFQNGPSEPNNTFKFGQTSTQPTTAVKQAPSFSFANSSATTAFGTPPSTQTALGTTPSSPAPSENPTSPSWTPPVPPRFVPGVGSPRPPGAVPPPSNRSRSRSSRPPQRAGGR